MFIFLFFCLHFFSTIYLFLRICLSTIPVNHNGVSSLIAATWLDFDFDFDLDVAEFDRQSR